MAQPPRRRADTPIVAAALSEFLAKVDAGRWDEGESAHVVDIRDARRQRGRRRAPAKPHYETQLSQDVARAMKFAAEKAQIVLVTGSYGFGKTHAVVRWIREEGDEAVYFRFQRACMSRWVFLTHLAAALGCDTPPISSGLRAAAGMAAIVARLREEPKLLVLDQCEAVPVETLQVVRDIWDDTAEAGVGVALLASEELYTRLTRSRAGDLGALTSRIAGHFVLKGLEAGELRAIAGAEGLEIDQRTAQTWANLAGGSMRRFLESLELLRAAHGDRAVTPKTVEGVFAMQI